MFFAGGRQIRIVVIIKKIVQTIPRQINMFGKTKIIIIAGPTGAGKSALGAAAAERFNGEVVSADSMQVYREMDIGTAKPKAEELSKVRHHLIDIVSPDEDYDAEQFRRDAEAAIDEIRSRGKNAFIVGGTGLYIKALTSGLIGGIRTDQALRAMLADEVKERGRAALHERLKALDPASAAAIHPNNIAQVTRAIEISTLAGRPASELRAEHAFSDEPYETLKIGVTPDRSALYRAINGRVDAMIEAGLIIEVKRLLEKGYSRDLKPMCSLGYKEILGCQFGEYSLDEAIRLIKRNTRHYAKRQLTWFRRDADFRWFAPSERDDIIKYVEEFLR